tara:strand:+ start:2062 stop:2751 length:690 start_codon:yes stop_codon:yes gene_type:complete
MDPVTVMATATAAFNAVKKGVSIGKDIESMASDLGRWMGALSDLDMLEKEAKNPPIFKKLFAGKSVEQEAIEAFAAKEKAQQQRTDLKNFIGMMYGHSKWEQLLKTEASIRKSRAETIHLQRQRRRKFVEIVAWILMSLLAVGLLTGFVLLLKGHAARAQPDHVVCRLVGCEIINKKRYCVYRGVKTQETVVLEPSEWFPREYQCKYDPDAPKPPTLQETLKAIRESQR